MSSDTGDKNLIFLHYFGGSAKSWQWVQEKLKDYNCLALNLPGFGKTPPLEKISLGNMAAFVLNEIKVKDLSSCILVGHSMGGKIALQAAVMDSENLVSRLILIAPSPPGTEPMEEEEQNRMLDLNPREAEKTVEKSTVAVLSEKKYQTAVSTQLEADLKTWRWWLLQGMKQPVSGSVQDLSLPVYVLASDLDPVITPQVIKNCVMKKLSSGILITTKTSGHLIPVESSEWVASAIKKILL